MNNMELKEFFMDLIKTKEKYKKEYEEYIVFLSKYNSDMDIELLCSLQYVFNLYLCENLKLDNPFFKEFLLYLSNPLYNSSKIINNEKYSTAIALYDLFFLEKINKNFYDSYSITLIIRDILYFNECKIFNYENSIINEFKLELYRVFTYLDESKINYLKNQLRQDSFDFLIDCNPNEMKLFQFKEVKECNTDNSKKFIYKYILYYKNKKNQEKKYEVASRNKFSCIDDIGSKTNAIMIVPFTTDGKIVLLKEFRMGINNYIYNFPAGIIESGEDEISAAKRELYEETGLNCVNIKKVLRPAFSSAGLTDEKVTVVFMEVEGELSNEHIEDNESIIPIKFDKNSLEKELEIADFGGKTQLICYNFVNPF